MLKAVLFDLDGTLLHLDTRRFVDAYVRLLARWFAARIPPERFVAHLLTATQAMMANRDPGRTNREVFAAAFYPALGVTEAETAPRLAEFYAREYPALRRLTRLDPNARKAVMTALDRGLDVVIATNPIFPASAVRQRLEWAGIADLPFALVTTYENAHFCKPHPEYFLEVAATIGRRPEECLMAGNDAGHDAAAMRAGMRAYLVTDNLIAGPAGELRADYMGTLADLVVFLTAVDLASA